MDTLKESLGAAIWKWLAAAVLLAIRVPVAADQVRVYTESYPPYSYVTKEGQIDGLAVRLVRQVLDASSLDYRLIIVPWNRAYRAALEEDNSLIFTIARVPEREGKFDWLVQLGEVKFHLYGRRDDARLDTPAMFHRALREGELKLACLVNDISCALVDDMKLPPGAVFRIAEKARPDVLLVLAGRADLYVAEEIHNRYRLMRLGLGTDRLKPVHTLDTDGRLYLAAGFQVNEAIRQQVRAGAEKLRQAGAGLAFDMQQLESLPD